jgi:LPS-assembly protein
MTRLRAILLFPFCFLALCASLQAQPERQLEIDAPEGGVVYEFKTGLLVITNGVIKYGGAVLTCDRASASQTTMEVIADGNVRIQQDDQTWVGEHIRYNFRTRQMETALFRTGKYPVFASAHGLSADITNRVYNATNAFITTDDFSKPAIRIRAKHIRVVPGKRIEATHATFYLGDVPVFYLPYYSRTLAPGANSFNVTPGYRSAYGPFMLGSYNFHLSGQFDGAIHLDYRVERGVGAGPDLNFHLGRWGEGTFRYYYTRDNDPETNALLNPLVTPLMENRQRVYFSYLAAPATNLEVRALVRYQNDIGVIHDFFQDEYRQNPQPDTYIGVNKFWQNFSLDVLARPRVNDFYETVERLPEVRLTGYRQRVGRLPFYYESQSSAGYYRWLSAGTNNPFLSTNDFWSARADTWHQLTLPVILFGWLNVTPRAGGRLTYYDAVSGLGGLTNSVVRTNSETYRGVFNTGVEVSFKASRLWPDVRNETFDLHGVRHIIQPSANYVYVPTPNYEPAELPQFDRELPSLRLLPLEFPEYNAIDSIDSQSVIRLGLANKLQTKRNGRVEDLLRWEVFTDWRLRPRTIQGTNRQDRFSDVYSDLTLKPRAWMTLQSQTRVDPNNGRWNLALTSLTLEPNNTWSWTIGHLYLRDDLRDVPTALGEGNNLVSSSLFYRLNENWGFRMRQHYDARHGRMQEQSATIYRDLRFWTAALTGGVRDNRDGPVDYMVAFTFSLKAMPRYALGRDTVRHDSLLGE